MSGPTAQLKGGEDRTLLPGYADWLARVEMTRESVAYCCYHRLDGDRRRAEAVSVEVIGGLLARPKVWQYFGLPFSGRVAHLTERGLADAEHGGVRPDEPSRWPAVLEELRSLDPEDQRVVTLTCCDGSDDAALAAALGCDEARAAARREAALARLTRAAERATGRRPVAEPTPTEEL